MMTEVWLVEIVIIKHKVILPQQFYFILNK